MTRFKTAGIIVLFAGLLCPLAVSGAGPATAPAGSRPAQGAAAEKGQRAPVVKKSVPLREPVRRRGDDRNERGEAWLGVQLAPVPEALAAQLGLDDKGVMVRNVFMDSPAHRAGIDRYDVIVAVDGKELVHNITLFSEIIRSHEAGDSVTLAWYHRARLKTQTIKLGEMPAESAEMTLKYEDDWSDVFRRPFRTRNGDMRPWLKDWPGDERGESPEMPRYRYYRRWPDYPKDWDRLKKGIEQYGEDIERYRDELRDYLRKYEDRLEPPSAPSFQRHDRDEKSSVDTFGQPRPPQPPPSLPRSEERAMPGTQFDVHPDHSISVHIQHGAGGLNMTFPNEEALRRYAPKLYEQYREMLNGVK